MQQMLSFTAILLKIKTADETQKARTATTPQELCT